MNQNYLAVGERIKLDNGKTYLCLNAVKDESRYFVLLVTAQEPLEICFAEQTSESLRIVGGKEEKQRLKQLFERSVIPRGGEGND